MKKLIVLLVAAVVAIVALFGNSTAYAAGGVNFGNEHIGLGYYNGKFFDSAPESWTSAKGWHEDASVTDKFIFNQTTATLKLRKHHTLLREEFIYLAGKNVLTLDYTSKVTSTPIILEVAGRNYKLSEGYAYIKVAGHPTTTTPAPVG